MSDYLFAYGTLQPDHVAPEVSGAVARLRPVGKGYVHGLLYDLGEYPGAILSAATRRRIHGTVFRLAGEPGTLGQLDEYEGFDPDNPSDSLFVRKLHSVMLPSGRSVPCWIYEYNREPGAARLVTGGVYRGRERRAARRAPVRPSRASGR